MVSKHNKFFTKKSGYRKKASPVRDKLLNLGTLSGSQLLPLVASHHSTEKLRSISTIVKQPKSGSQYQNLPVKKKDFTYDRKSFNTLTPSQIRKSSQDLLKPLPESRTQVQFGTGDVSANLSKYNLKDALLGRTSMSKSKPVLSISKDDLSTIVRGKSPSNGFITEN